MTTGLVSTGLSWPQTDSKRLARATGGGLIRERYGWRSTTRATVPDAMSSSSKT